MNIEIKKGVIQMKLKSFNKINTSTKVSYLVYDKRGNNVDSFKVDYCVEYAGLADAIRKRESYSNAKVLWCDPSCIEIGRLMVGLEVD